jgi:hypothetical protein
MMWEVFLVLLGMFIGGTAALVVLALFFAKAMSR